MDHGGQQYLSVTMTSSGHCGNQQNIFVFQHIQLIIAKVQLSRIVRSTFIHLKVIGPVNTRINANRDFHQKMAEEDRRLLIPTVVIIFIYCSDVNTYLQMDIPLICLSLIYL